MRNLIAILGIIALFGTFANAGIQPASQPSGGSVNGTSISPSDVTTSTLTTHAAYVKNDLTVGSSVTFQTSQLVAGTSNFIITPGMIGIGQASPQAMLHINTGNGDGTALTGIKFGSDATAVLTRDNSYGGSLFLGSLRTTGAQNFFGGGQGSGTIELYAIGNGFARDGGTGDFYMRVNSQNSLTLRTGNGGVLIYSRTKAQLKAITPAVGDMFYCSDCSDPTSGKATVVIGTGPSAGNFGTLPVGAFQ